MAEMKSQPDAFITAEQVGCEEDGSSYHQSGRGVLMIAACRSGSCLAEKVAHCYNLRTREHSRATGSSKPAEPVRLELDLDHSFSDSETGVRVESHVSGTDVFLFQGLCNPLRGVPVDQNYLSFLIAARAFREHGARHITGVLPYLAYGRQDKPTRFTREPTTARLMADLGSCAGADRIITFHPHSQQLRGFYGTTTVHMLDPLPLFVEEFREFRSRDDCIVVAPDAGALKLATYFSRSLGVSTAIAAKFRPRPEEVEYSEIIGRFSGKKVALILDDILSSGGTAHTLVRLLVREKGIREVHLGISHNLCREEALLRLQELHRDYRLKRVVITDSIPQSGRYTKLPFLSIRSLADTLCRTINRIHYNRSVSDLFPEI